MTDQELTAADRAAMGAEMAQALREIDAAQAAAPADQQRPAAERQLEDWMTTATGGDLIPPPTGALAEILAGRRIANDHELEIVQTAVRVYGRLMAKAQHAELDHYTAKIREDNAARAEQEGTGQ